ncbi:MAG TPA: AAA family ATPase, partial [Candidatus Limnocylindrales bacterium]
MSGVGGRLFGRTQESAEALAFLDRAAERPVGLVLEGVPGIGKTTVWRAALDEARARGIRTLSCAGAQAEIRLSLAAVGDLLDDVADDELRRLPAPQREALERAVFRRDGSPDVADARRIGFGLRSLLVGLAATGPLLVAVDDAQWLDAASAEALAFAVRRLSAHPVGVLMTIRPSTGGEPLDLRHALGDDRTTLMRLGPLTDVELRGLIAARLQFDYPEPLMARIVATTDGNPLFALEVARALGPTPAQSHIGHLPVPDSLREAIRARVGVLGADARQALLAAAELARPSVDLVERASSADGLVEAEEAGLVRVDGARVAFEHPLYAAAVYETASSRRRRAMHLQLAALVSDDEERARHLALGAVPPDALVAAALDVGASQAQARGAWGAAAELLELAMAFTPEAEMVARQERAVRAASHHMRGGERAQGRRLLDELLASTATRAVRCEALRLMAEMHTEAENGHKAAYLCLMEALELADTPAERVAIHLPLADMLSASNDIPSADLAGSLLHAGLAVHEAEALGDPGLIAEAIAAHESVRFLSGGGVDRAAVERALALEDPARGTPMNLRPRMSVAMLEVWNDQFDESRTHFVELCREAADTGDEISLADVLSFRSWVEVRVGNFTEAIEIAEEAQKTASLADSSVSRAWAVSSLTFSHGVRGDADRARSAGTEALALCEGLGFWTPLLWASTGLGLLELSLGDARAAWDATRPLTERTERSMTRNPSVHHYLPVAIEALVQLGELDRAERLIDWLEERARAAEHRSLLAFAFRARG